MLGAKIKQSPHVGVGPGEQSAAIERGDPVEPDEPARRASRRRAAETAVDAAGSAAGAARIAADDRAAGRGE
jgi:hypothetical protein